MNANNVRNGTQEALGLVETKGLIATIAATDAMCKAANVASGRASPDRRRLRHHLRPRRRRLRPRGRGRRPPRPPASTASWSAPTSSPGPKKPSSRCSWALINAMKILVANLGSTSFKYRLFDMADEKVLRAAASNGSAPTRQALRRGRGTTAKKPPWRRSDHAVAVRFCLDNLADKKRLTSPQELAAIGFKTVHARD